jgi:hypothetical protein
MYHLNAGCFELVRMRSIGVTIAVAATLALSGPTAFAQKDVPTIVSPWKGEYFSGKQGGLYVKIATEKFAASAQTKFLTGNIQITAYNLLSKRTYIVSHKMARIDGYPAEIWKLPSGKYELRSIEMVDTAGVRRRWVTGLKNRKTFIVKRQCLSNLGLWTLRPFGKDKLSVKFEMIPNSYSEMGAKKESSVAVVLDGFSGLVQEQFGGKRVLAGADDDHSGKNEIRAVITYTRQISMFYALNLFRHNYLAQAVSQVLIVYDPNLRRCYTDRLEYNENLRGDVKFTFLLSKASGTMTKLKNTGGSAADPKLVRCMYLELAQIQFPVKENIVGEVTYTYDIR